MYRVISQVSRRKMGKHSPCHQLETFVADEMATVEVDRSKVATIVRDETEKSIVDTCHMRRLKILKGKRSSNYGIEGEEVALSLHNNICRKCKDNPT